MLSVYEQRDCSKFLRVTCFSLLIYAGVANVGTATADVSLPAIIGDNMVLQRQTETLIWGWAEPGERVRVTADWLSAEVATTANDDGEWQVRLKTPDAGGPHTINITAGNTITLNDVMIGEVWICSGQSNMEWPLGRVLNGEAEIAAANHPSIRLLDVERAIALSPKPDCEGVWQVCSPETVGKFSAVGYFFGRELQRELDVPIGLINSSWGGTVAEAWTSEKTLREMGDFDAALDALETERQNPGYLEKTHEQAVKRWWEVLEDADPGSGSDGWTSPSYDDSDWKLAKVPATWQTDDLKDFDGVAWFRAELELPEAWAGKNLILELGPIDDFDSTWFNGTKVGSLERVGNWGTPRKYRVPAAATKVGRNVIAVRVCDLGRAGGINGKPEQLKLYPADGGDEAARSLAGEWRYHLGVKLGDLPPWPRTHRLHHNSPTALYNGMIAPLVPYGIRGAIWYQGEANRPRPRQYRTLFPRMIRDWRQRWGRGDFPFYYVQIAPFGYARDTGQAAELREAQMMALATPNTGMAVTMDIGNPRNIHPKNKQDVGKRLALWALANTYGRDGIVYSGPLYKSMKVEGDKIRLFFEHVGGGLTSGGKELTHFSIAGEDRRFCHAKAKIDGDTVVVWSAAVVPKPVAVRYAWGAADQPTLANQEGLPASSFRTDGWPGVLVPPPPARPSAHHDEQSNLVLDVPSGATFASIASDGAWSWFVDPRGVYYEGLHRRTYLGWVNRSGDIQVASYDHDTGKLRIATVHAGLDKNDHVNPAIVIRPDGRVMVFYSGHAVPGTPVRSILSTRPEDITDWEAARTTIAPTPGGYRICYPNPVQLSAERNRLYLFWRGSEWKTMYATSDDGVSWTAARRFIAGRKGDRDNRPYCKFADNGRDRIDVAFTTGHPRREPHNSIYYASCRNGALYRADGTKIKGLSDGALTYEEAELVYDAKRHGARAWIWDLASDAEGHPVLVYAACPTESDHRYRYARWDGRQWVDHEICTAGGWFPQTPPGKREPEPHYSGGVTLDHSDPSAVYLSRPRDGVFEIEKWTTTDHGRTWKSERITGGSSKNNVRPFVVRNHPAGDSGLFWMHGDYVHYLGSYHTAIKMHLSASERQARLLKDQPNPAATTNSEGLKRGANPRQLSAKPHLRLDAPIERWDEAIPLGNGLTGGLLWGGGNVVRLSLDRGDLWDLRTPPMYQRSDWNYATMQRLVAEGDQATMQQMFDTPYTALPFPTKIPGGRLELTLDPSCQAKQFKLDIRRAEAAVALGQHELRAFFSAAEPVTLMHVSGPMPSLRLMRPAGLSRLGYEPAREGHDDDTLWMVQEAAAGLTYAVVVGTRAGNDATVLAIAITSTADGPDPLEIGRRRVAEALEAGYQGMLGPHLAWWRDFWSISSVAIPNRAIQAHYDLVKYFYGAASRAKAPPMPLQGVWTADEEGLPPWKGDFHNDLNTQMTYLAYHAAGLVESGESFIDFNWCLLPTYQDFARRFYNADGAVVPGVMALDGQPLGGWGQYSLSPTMGAWVAQSFYLHWRYTTDETFLRERAYPWCAQIGRALAGLLRPDERGKLILPLSTSPEIFDNSMRAWLEPNSNFDLALLRWLFGALGEMAEELGDQSGATEWRSVLARLDDYDVEGDAGSLTVARGIPYESSHRHFSHTMAIHPLGLLHVEGTDRDRAIVNASLDRILEKGTDWWVGYSFSWMACMLARAGRAEQALDMLQKYEQAFLLRNGFHANGDQSGTGLSRFTYRPFTLEGNFLAMQAVHEMLLQSWGGVVRVFPAVSERWRDVSFRDLRAEGGFRVSARREDGQTTSVRVAATRAGLLRLRDPFAGEQTVWNRAGVRKVGDAYEVDLKRGEVLTGQPGAAGTGRSDPRPLSDDYVLIWGDEFDSDALDPRKWKR